jgi:hypothetical protein
VVEPHICVVENRATDDRGEYVEVANGGANRVELTGLELTDYTDTQTRPHIYHFPGNTENGTLFLNPGESAFVFTGSGENSRGDNGNLYLFWNRAARVWNDDGDVAYLRRADGTFIDSRTVGDPKRHPNGH